MDDEILIRGLKVRTHIGVPSEERAEPQELVIHLSLKVGEFAREDCIEGTVDYQKVAERVEELAQEKERKIIETFANEIADCLLKEFSIEKVTVEIEKRILPQTDWVGVRIQRRRHEIQ